jgi:hypothetical protein
VSEWLEKEKESGLKFKSAGLGLLLRAETAARYENQACVLLTMHYTSWTCEYIVLQK